MTNCHNFQYEQESLYFNIRTFCINLKNVILMNMELLLKGNKKQLRVFADLAKMLNIQHHTITEEMEDKAFAKAIEDGDQSILDEKEAKEFENWLKK